MRNRIAPLMSDETDFKAGDAAAFWGWFSESAPQIEKDYDASVRGELDPALLIGPVRERLKAYSKELAFEIGCDGDGVYDFVISAEGMKDRIGAVTTLLQAAPKIEGWKFTAFRPRKELADVLLRMDGVAYGADCIFYRLDDIVDGLCDIEILYRGSFKASDDKLGGASLLIMDRLIGEYDVMTKIGKVSAHRIEASRGVPDDYKQITELAAEIDALFPQTRQ